MKRIVPKIDIYKTGQNIKHIMRMKGMTVKEIGRASCRERV